MEKSRPKILVRDVQTQQILFECSIEEAETAHKFAAEMEDIGLDLEVITPTLTETLSSSLGLSREAQEEYKQSMEEEMEHHEGSCCFKDDSETGNVH